MFFRILKKLKYRFIQTSYSQAGEDAIIRYLFADYGLSKISYLDLGTNTPDYGNNTYWFYLNNSTGVCVEADSSLINRIKKVRTNDIVLNLGVSTSFEKEEYFFIFNQPDLNTFNELEANEKSKSGKFKILSKKLVKLVTINSILDKYFKNCPDLLSIDIEGLDLDVLQSLDFNKYPIKVICAETCLYSENHIRSKNINLIDFMESRNYEVYASTYINTIFVNKDWFYKKSNV
jgi:FkbM family methyltransferase